MKKTKKRTLRRVFLRSRKRFIRFSLLSANVLLLAVVIFFVAKVPATGQPVHTSVATNTADAQPLAALDQVSSADIAVNVAHATGIPEATSVVNHADSVSAVEATAPADTAVVAKPQMVATALPSRAGIHTYTVASGDTISSIASKFGVSSDSIRWSNGLSGNAIAAGKQIVLPPNGVNAIVHTVASGETPDSLAQKYGVSKENIITFNDAEVTGLKVGEQIFIPDGVVQAPAVTVSYYRGFAWGGSAPVYTSNGYDYGWCTWWAAKRRGDIGRALPSNLGNASSWKYLAMRAGFGVDHNPSFGSVAYYGFIGGLGHVGFVERVNDDGSVWISDMNYYGVNKIDGNVGAGGWGRVSYHLVQRGELGGYLFIH